MAVKIAGLESVIAELDAWRGRAAPDRGTRVGTDRLKARQLLHGLIRQHLDVTDIRLLCYDLGIDFEELDGTGGKDGLITSLLLKSFREEQTGRVIARLREIRPSVTWPDVE